MTKIEYGCDHCPLGLTRFISMGVPFCTNLDNGESMIYVSVHDKRTGEDSLKVGIKVPVVTCDNPEGKIT